MKKLIEIIETALEKSENGNMFIITDYSMISDVSDNSHQQQVRLKMQGIGNPKEINQEIQIPIFENEILPKILNFWAQDVEAVPELVLDKTPAIKVWGTKLMGTETLTDILIIQDTDNGWYITQTYNDMW